MAEIVDMTRESSDERDRPDRLDRPDRPDRPGELEGHERLSFQSCHSYQSSTPPLSPISSPRPSRHSWTSVVGGLPQSDGQRVTTINGRYCPSLDRYLLDGSLESLGLDGRGSNLAALVAMQGVIPIDGIEGDTLLGLNARIDGNDGNDRQGRGESDGLAAHVRGSGEEKGSNECARDNHRHVRRNGDVERAETGGMGTTTVRAETGAGEVRREDEDDRKVERSRYLEQLLQQTLRRVLDGEVNPGAPQERRSTGWLERWSAGWSERLGAGWSERWSAGGSERRSGGRGRSKRPVNGQNNRASK